MVNYTSNLKLWGSTGQEYPDNYSYQEGEQPVDAWDNFFAYNVQQDLDHLIDVTNNELLARDGSVDLQADFVDDQGNTIWDYSNGYVPSTNIQDSFVLNTGDTINGDLDVTGTIDEGSDRVATRNWTNNNADVPNADDADTLQGNAPSDLGGVDYIQNSEPTGASDGEVWADTSDPARPLHVYSADRAEWVPTFESVPLFVTQEAVSFGESDVSLSHTNTEVSSGSVQLGNVTDSYDAPPTETSVNGLSNYWYGWEVEIPAGLIEISVTFEVDLGSNTWGLYDKTENQWIANESASVNTISFSPPDPSHTYHLTAEWDGSDYPYQNANLPIDAGDLTITGIQYAQNGGPGAGGSDDNMGVFDTVDTVRKTTNGNTVVSFGQIKDLAAWDRVTAQTKSNDGSVTYDIEFDDGTGWSVFATGVAMPYSISSIAPDSDVRVVANLSRPTVGDSSPQVPYVARRGER